MSRSFAFERTRINIEIWCENMSDYCSTFGGSLRKPLMALAGIALIMTLRSARRGVQTMKRGGLTAGDSWFGSSKANAYGASPYNRSPYQGGSSSSPYPGASAHGGKKKSFFSRAFGSSHPDSAIPYAAGGLGSSSAYGSTTSMSNRLGSGSSSYSPPPISGSSSYSPPPIAAAGPAMCNGPCRHTSDLVNEFEGRVRVMDAVAYKDYGGVYGFFGQVDTLTANEGAGVVEKVLEGSGTNKVLVIDGGGNVHSAILTKKALENAKASGWKGVIVHGAVQHAHDLQSIGVGVKALGTYPSRGKATSGSKGNVLNIAGMQFGPNMWVYCDKDGIVLSDTELTPGTPSSLSMPTPSTGSASSSASSTPGQPGTPGATTGMNGMSTQNGMQPGMSTQNGMQNQQGMQTHPGMPNQQGMQTHPGMPNQQGMQTHPGMPNQQGMQTHPGMQTTQSGNQMNSGLPPYSATGTNNYARNLPNGYGQKLPNGYGGNSAYPYSNGGENPYTYSASKKGNVSLSIWLPVALSIAMLWRSRSLS